MSAPHATRHTVAPYNYPPLSAGVLVGGNVRIVPVDQLSIAIHLSSIDHHSVKNSRIQIISTNAKVNVGEERARGGRKGSVRLEGQVIPVGDEVYPQRKGKERQREEG